MFLLVFYINNLLINLHITYVCCKEMADMWIWLSASTVVVEWRLNFAFQFNKGNNPCTTSRLVQLSWPLLPTSTINSIITNNSHTIVLQNTQSTSRPGIHKIQSLIMSYWPLQLLSNWSLSVINLAYAWRQSNNWKAFPSPAMAGNDFVCTVGYSLNNFTQGRPLLVTGYNRPYIEYLVGTIAPGGSTD